MCLSDLAEVVAADGPAHEAVVDIDGRRMRVSTLTLGLDAAPPVPGEWLVVHTGFAVERLSAAAASQILHTRRELAADQSTEEEPPP